MKKADWMGIAMLALCCTQVSCGKKDAEVAAPDPAGSHVHAIGYVEPKERLRRLAFDSQGVIAEVTVDMGEEVRKGDLLASLRDDEQAGRIAGAERRVAVFEAELALLKAGAHPEEIAAMEAGYEAALVDRDFRNGERERLGKLADVQGVAGSVAAEAVNKADLAEMEAKRLEAALGALRKRTRDVDLALAEARVEEARQALEIERVLLDQRKLRAPSDGRVVEVFKRGGEMVSQMEGDPVILFAPAGRLEVRAEVDEVFWDRIREGAVARVKPAGSDEMEGTVRVMKRAMGRKNVFSRAATERMDLQVFEVWIELPESVDWPLGMEVDVKIKEEAGDE